MLRGYVASVGGGLPEGEREELVAEACRYRTKTCQVLLADWQRDDPGTPALHRAIARVENALASDRRPPRLDEIALLFPGAAPASDGVTSPQFSKHIDEIFTSFYHHAVPFDAERVVGVWSRCRDEAAVTHSCEEDLARARERFPMEGDEQLMKQLPSCGNAQVIGQSCQEGMSRIQRMLGS
jgi:hypothetical protein